MTSQPGEQAFAIHILPNFSENKDNYTMKFGHLLECNMKNIFLEKTNTKCGRKTLFPDPFLKNQN